MASILSKLDSELGKIYSNYRDLQRLGPKEVGWLHPVVERGKRFYLYVAYEGDLSALEAVGLVAAAEQRPGEALGLVELADLERLAEHPQVLALRVGSAPRWQLDASIPDVQANQVWTLNPTAGTFTGTTGKGVILGFIDSGIDFGHPDFIKPNSDPKQTRVLRIWDQGITPIQEGEQGPDASLLSGGLTYGVEYDRDDINEHLKPGDVLVAQRDCNGHGTHVASIAAGNGAESKFKYVGVAPEADIIMVKYFDPVEKPIEDVDGNIVPDEKRLKDAVRYILNVAHAIDPNRPVVLNMSLGWDTGPHDGMSPEEVWLNEQFPLDAVGRACVVSCGNNGGPHQAGTLTLTDPGQVTFTLKMIDARTSKSDHDRCAYHDNTHSIGLELWYPMGPALGFAVRVPGADVSALTEFVTLGNSASGFFSGRKKYEITHKTESINVGGTIVSRNVAMVTFYPEGSTHAEGLYDFRVSSDVAVTINAWTDNHGRQILRFTDILESVQPKQLQLSDRMQIAALGGAPNLIAVAAYASDARVAANDPIGDDPELHQIAPFSSRGPLVSYMGATPPEKPEIGAPGARIDAAKTGGSCWWSLVRLGLRPYGYQQLNGTSMAAPHVAGAVALMFQEKPTLTLAQVRQLLLATADPATDSADPEEIARARLEFGAGRLNVRRAVEAAAAL